MTDTTPRPLKIIETDYGPIRVVAANGDRFCEIACAMALTAHEIVTAVNVHDDLVKALEEMSADYDDMPRHDTGILERARSALAKAKGEKT